jgi:hypothetical protein
MAYEQVDVYVLDERTGSPPLPGVLVRVYDAAGRTFFTESTTDAQGKAGFLLWSQTYSLRFYRFATSFQQPQLIEVLSAPATPGTTPNAFNVYGSAFVPPMATDPRLCRASGYFRDVTGAPRPQLDLHFIGKFEPVLLEGALVMDERRQVKTDKNGYACVDLIRCAEYTVTIEAFEDQPRTIRVPDSASCNLPDLLFPVVGAVQLVVAPLAVNEERQVYPVVLDTAGVPIPGTAYGDVTWSMEDPSVVALTVGQTYLILKGLKAGVTNLLATRKDKTIIRIPDTGIMGVPVSVTVV